MPLFSGLPWLRGEHTEPRRDAPKHDHEDFSELEKHFFEQGEDAAAMKTSPEERISDLNIAEQEKKTGHLERGFFERSDIADMVNTLKRTGNLDSINQPPEVKVAFLRNMADQLKAKKAAFKSMNPVPFEDVQRLTKKIARMEDLQVKYGMEIDFDGGPDGGEEITLDEEEEEEPLAA